MGGNKYNTYFLLAYNKVFNTAKLLMQIYKALELVFANSSTRISACCLYHARHSKSWGHPGRAQPCLIACLLTLNLNALGTPGPPLPRWG